MHGRGRETKKLNRVDIGLIYSLYKDEYRNHKLTETTIRKGIR
jgi:hypothetical protein